MDLEKLERRVKATQRIAVGLLVGTAVVYAAWFGFMRGKPLSDDPGVWGQFGDYIGGLLNPVMAFLAFYWLTQSVRLQKTELEATRSELASAASAQKQQAELAAQAAQISALGTLLSSANAEIAEIAQVIKRLRASTPARNFDAAVCEAKMQALQKHRDHLTHLLNAALADLGLDIYKAEADSDEAPPAP